MNWSKGFSATYYGCFVDPVSWADTERFEIISGSVNHSNEDLMESASVTVTQYDRAVERWIRIYLDTKQNESGAHTPLFTGLAVSPDDDIDGFYSTQTLDCYSVLKPADDILLQRGWYAPAESNGGQIIKELLSGFAPLSVADGAPHLSQAVIAEDGETNLSMAHKILKAMNWRIKIGGNGVINVIPKPIEVAASFDPNTNDVIEPQIKLKHDWFDCPNCFRAISDDLTGIAKDESNGPLSIERRGREVWTEESGVDLAGDESIGEYASRRLKEEQSYGISVSYYRRYDPDVSVGDLVSLRYRAQGISGIYSVISQSIELGYGARVSEEVNYESDN